MKTWTHNDIDKREWGDGPWVNEPDKAVWVDDATGLDCMVKRNHNGAWCGYVGVPRSHPFYGKGYDAFDVDVHGGLTYAGPCEHRPAGMSAEEFEAHAICHVPEPGRPECVWWFGFDCHHAFDIGPAMDARMRELHDPVLDRLEAERHEHEQNFPPHLRPQYRDFAYVGGEVLRLAVELTAAARP